MKLIFILALLLCTGYPAVGTTVYLHESAVVDQSPLELQAIALVSGALPAQRIAEHPLELPLNLSLLPIRNIRKQLPDDGRGIIFIGGRIFLIPSRYRAQAPFYNGLLAFLEKQINDPNAHIELEMISEPRLPEGEAQLADAAAFEFLRVDRKKGLLAGEALIAFQSGNTEGTFAVWIHHFLPAARASQAIPGLQILDEKYLVYVDQDISLNANELLFAGDNPNRYRVLKTLSKGTLIERQMLQKEQAVRAGDRVAIHFLRKSIRLRFPGRALASGSVGDFVEVKALDSSRRFTGVIVGPKEIQVDSP